MVMPIFSFLLLTYNKKVRHLCHKKFEKKVFHIMLLSDQFVSFTLEISKVWRMHYSQYLPISQADENEESKTQFKVFNTEMMLWIGTIEK